MCKDDDREFPAGPHHFLIRSKQGTRAMVVGIWDPIPSSGVPHLWDYEDGMSMGCTSYVGRESVFEVLRTEQMYSTSYSLNEDIIVTKDESSN